MATFPNFVEQMPRKSDEELFGILAHRDDYMPEAIAAAEQELNKRNIEPPKIAEFQTLAKEKKDEEDIISNEPLSWPIRIILFLFPVGIPQFILAEHYRGKSKRKAEECWTWMVYGIIFYAAIFILRLFLAAVSCNRY